MTYTATQQKNRQIVIDALKSQNVKAFLDLIAYTEGTDKLHGYYTRVGGSKISNLNDHPGGIVNLGTNKKTGKQLRSNAAGRYQFMKAVAGTGFANTWPECKTALGLTDFSSSSQDMAAVYLIHRRKALNDLIQGKFYDALFKCAREWASFPKSHTEGSVYNQHSYSSKKCEEFYKSRGGKGFFFLQPNPKPNSQPARPTNYILPIFAIIAWYISKKLLKYARIKRIKRYKR